MNLLREISKFVSDIAGIDADGYEDAVGMYDKLKEISNKAKEILSYDPLEK